MGLAGGIKVVLVYFGVGNWLRFGKAPTVVDLKTSSFGLDFLRPFLPLGWPRMSFSRSLIRSELLRREWPKNVFAMAGVDLPLFILLAIFLLFCFQRLVVRTICEGTVLLIFFPDVISSSNACRSIETSCLWGLGECSLLSILSSSANELTMEASLWTTG